jgi:hypothetical protein
MSWGISILVGLITAAACALAAGWVANLCVSWYRISSFEGGSGYWVIFMGLLGLLFGLVAGIVTTRFAGAGFLKGQGLALAVGLGGIALVGLAARLGADIPPTMNGEELSLLVELRCPRGVEPEHSEEIDHTSCRATALGSGNRRGRQVYGTVRWQSARLADGQWTIPCEVFVHTSGEMLVGLKVNSTQDYEFLLPRPRVWGAKQTEWGEWRSDRILQEVGKPKPEFAYRFRVRPVSEVRAEEKAREIAEQQEQEARFASLRQDSPLEEWLRYAQADGDKGRKAREMVRSRLSEVPEVLRSRDSEVLRLLAVAMGNMQELPASAEEPLRRSARVIAERVRDFEGSAEDDRARELATQIRGAYYWWHYSIDRVEGHKQSDFRKELLLIREEAEKRRADFNWQPLADSSEQGLKEMDAPGN